MYSKYAGANSLNIRNSIGETTFNTMRSSRVLEKVAPDFPPGSYYVDSVTDVARIDLSYLARSTCETSIVSGCSFHCLAR